MSNEIKDINNELIDIEIIYKDIKEKILVARGKMLKHIDTTYSTWNTYTEIRSETRE